MGQQAANARQVKREADILRTAHASIPADAVTADEVPREEMHFAILWNLSRKGVLQPLYLVCPKRFNPRTGEIEVWWDVVIPDPTTAIQPGPSGLSIAPREDLDIARKDKKKEQSE